MKFFRHYDFCLSEPLSPFCGTLGFHVNKFQKQCSAIRSCATEKSASRRFEVTYWTHFKGSKYPKQYCTFQSLKKRPLCWASQPKRTAYSTTQFWKLHSPIKCIASRLTLRDFSLPPRSKWGLRSSVMLHCVDSQSPKFRDRLSRNYQSTLRNTQEGRRHQS